MPKLVVSCILERDNELLMGMKKGDRENGQFCFPGGKVEENEKIAIAATRELKEETNLVVYPHQWRFVGYTEPDNKIIMFLYTKQFFGDLKCLDKNFVCWEWIDKCNWPYPCVQGMELFRELWQPEVEIRATK
jgi:8-oxo-dGTP diphosphatase